MAAGLSGECTGGVPTLEVSANAPLGKEGAVLEQIQAGVVNICAGDFGGMRKPAPELGCISFCGLCVGRDRWRCVMDSEPVVGRFGRPPKSRAPCRAARLPPWCRPARRTGPETCTG